MQNVLIEKPYQFTPPIDLYWPQRLLIAFGYQKTVLRKRDGVVDHECRHIERLKDSLAAGHGILLTPNHPRTADPIAMYNVSNEAGCSLYTMASWHLFNNGWFTRFMVRIMGGFSVNREGLDRAAIDYAVKVLVEGNRPLLIFPEGTTSRINDRLMGLMDGPAFIARTAAKRRAKKGEGKVVVHPVGIKYLFQGDIEKAVLPVLAEIEHRLTWRSHPDMSLIDRIVKIGDALLTLKELEYHVDKSPLPSLRERQCRLVNHLLNPLENEWLGKDSSENIATRVKNLRMKIFPEMSRSVLDEAERKRRWRQLEDTYLAQQIDCYPEQYLTELQSVDRILETVEKFEEDLTDVCRIHGNQKVVMEVGEAIEVSPEKVRGAEVDPLMAQIQSSLEEMMGRLQMESNIYEG